MRVTNGIKRLVHGVLPRAFVNFVWNLGSDARDVLLGRRKAGRPQPWRVWHNVGGGDFHATGRHFRDLFAEAVNLQPGFHVLDLGCGAGRLAFPLAESLDETGRYTGFDLSGRALGFARKHVTSRARIEFVRAQVESREYAASGQKASGYVFPAEDNSVDAALAISLFSHLLPEDAAHYLAETGRVLKPGGRVFLTGFLVEAEQKGGIGNPDHFLPMRPFADGVWAADPRHPERAIGFDRALFDQWVKAAGLVWAAPVVAGFWSRTGGAGDFQDTIVLEKRH